MNTNREGIHLVRVRWEVILSCSVHGAFVLFKPSKNGDYRRTRYVRSLFRRG
jgi:hypothetical protein